MAASFETQRLISMSLGKIAQSRGQRGGINLHKNLLVATVLHKARTAYMMESYTYQQTLQRQQQQQKQQAELQQRQQQQQQCLEQQQQIQEPEPSVTSSSSSPIPMCVEELQQQTPVTSSNVDMSCPETAPLSSSQSQESSVNQDSANLGQADATRTDREECRTIGSTDTPVAAASATDATPSFTYESSTVTSIKSPVVVAIDCDQHNEMLDKENSPPSATEITDSSSTLSINSSPIDHLAAATQLAQDSAPSNNVNKISFTSASPTCKVLKRRRDNLSAVCAPIECESDQPVSKKARVTLTTSTCDYDAIHSTSQVVQSSVSAPDLISDLSLGSNSTDDSDSDSETEQEVFFSTQQQPSVVDSPQISNLVNIFNSGFSGLCAVTSDSERESANLCDKNNSEIFKSAQLRPVLSRQDSLSCSSEMGRMESVPSAIILSA